MKWVIFGHIDLWREAAAIQVLNGKEHKAESTRKTTESKQTRLSQRSFVPALSAPVANVRRCRSLSPARSVQLVLNDEFTDE